MLHTNSNAQQPPQLALFNGSAPESGNPSQGDQPTNTAPCSRSAQFLALFELLTGWQAEFEESRESLKRRQNVAMENEPPQGDFRIVDMSSAWPAKTPTAHRGRCDQLIQLFGQLMTELQDTRIELVRAHSALEALSPGTIHQEADVVDSFVPKFSNPADDQDQQSLLMDALFADQQAANVDEDGSEFTLAPGVDQDFNVHQEVSDIRNGQSEAWKEWTVGGSTGIADSVYLDWFLDDNQLSICVGKIESSFGIGDSEVMIELDPELARYRVSGHAEIEAFFVWDRRGAKLCPVESSGEWISLPPAAAVIATTASAITAPDPEAELSTSPTAQQIATVIDQKLESDDKVLVLKRK